MNIFEYATREALRFSTTKGLLSTEDLWSLKLTCKSGFDLDSIAIAIDNQLKATTKSFVNKSTPENKTLEVKLEIVKHIINVKQTEQEAKAKSLVIASQRKVLEEAIARKKSEAVNSASLEELEAQLASLGA